MRMNMWFRVGRIGIGRNSARCDRGEADAVGVVATSHLAELPRTAKPSAFHPGSALLVVLGMLAFMVISGVAFSVYMRTTRLSSSFTRRTVTTRQLAKAALAEAIDQIDRAVANDPHPGVRNPYRPYYSMQSSGNSSSSGSSSGNPSAADFDPMKIDNFWIGRVLIGQGQSSQSNSDGNSTTEGAVSVNNGIYYPLCVDPADTASVLTLEALAYLPPPLVNEVRYYGQRTPTADWQTFDFDAGRFAYIAVDVSDFFDVNRIVSQYPRSSDPATRVTAGHLFEDGEHTKMQDASAWESFMKAYRTFNVSDGTVSFASAPPFVSIADFNLAIGPQTVGTMKSPFVQYVNGGNGGGNDGFYGSDPGSDDYEKYAEMTFVTDSLLAASPQTEKTTVDDNWDVLNLADDNNQIFKESFLHTGQENRKLIDIGAMKNVEPFSRLVQKRIPYVTMFALNDYLDSDRIPISLGMPSVERVPMICGIQHNLSSAGKFIVKSDHTVAETINPSATPTAWPATRTVTRTVKWYVDAASLAAMFQGGPLQVLVAYPFRNHEQQDESSWFKVDGKIQLFLSTEQMHLRTGAQQGQDFLHWTASGSAKDGGSAGLQSNKAIINLPLQAQPISLATVPISGQTVGSLDSKCVHEVRFDLIKFASDVASYLADPHGNLVTITYVWEETQTQQNDPWVVTGTSVNHTSITVPDASYCTSVTPDPNSIQFSPIKSDGNTIDQDVANVVQTTASNFQKDLYLNVALTLRVIHDGNVKDVLGESSGDTQTVDMVPATVYDDELNGINNGGLGGVAYQSLCGAPTPLMKFETTATPFTFTLTDLSSAAPLPIAPSPKAVMVNDPRYNHAPENWVEMSSFSASDWYTIARASAAANDGDIFMAASDQEYMQSVYELAFLPRMSDLVQYDDAIRGNLAAYPTTASDSWTKLAPNGTDLTKALDAGVMWRTYDIFGRYNTNGGDDFEGLGLEYEGKGLRVNPYSNLDSVLMAAFANTPHDWRAASNNEDTNPAGSSGMDNADTFNKKYVWNQYSSGAKLSWAKLETIAGQFYERMRDVFSHPNNVTYSEDKAFAISAVSDEYTPIWQDAFDAFFARYIDEGDGPLKFRRNHTELNAEQYLCDVKLDDSDCSSVYSVDKKFLYGYWKSCFAARQQLYLVFFRAEPMMLGGGVAGVTPPQLGAKGVALVWRDPYDPYERKIKSGNVTRHYPDPNGSSNDSYIPHGTRVLFYKQFE